MPLARELGLFRGKFQAGPLNAITDVAGVRVGHCTIKRDNLLTGVTAVLPHGGNLYRDKVVAAVDVINGFGKSVGLMQVEELGSIETPILLTNTFSIAPCVWALLKRAIAQNPDVGRETSTVNSVVLECNDGPLSDIQAMAVTEADAYAAIDAAREGSTEQGSIGAGTGMLCFGFKGGIGMASRRLELDDRPYTLGVLVLTNFGSMGNLVLPDGRRPKARDGYVEEKGSVIMIVGTDIPMESRQLRRVVSRCGVGIARLGSYWGHGSGDIALGFSTANRLNHDEQRDIVPTKIIRETRLEHLFEAVSEATEEAVINAMLMSPAVTGRKGFHAPSLAETLKKG